MARVSLDSRGDSNWQLVTIWSDFEDECKETMALTKAWAKENGLRAKTKKFYWTDSEYSTLIRYYCAKIWVRKN